MRMCLRTVIQMLAKNSSHQDRQQREKVNNESSWCHVPKNETLYT